MIVSMVEAHISQVYLRWSDFDRFGHLNNISYIEIAQEARFSHGRDLFGEHNLEVPPSVIRHIEASYTHPLLPDTVEAIVETTVTHIGNTSFSTRQIIRDRKGNECATITASQVVIDLKTGRPRPLTEAEHAVLESAITQ